MKFLMKLILMSYCAVVSPTVLTAGCDAPKQGPRGEPGPPFATSYASAYSQGIQVIPTGSSIAFTVNRIPPVGIVHAAATSPGRFQVLQDGLYYVSWTFTVQSAVERSFDVNIRNISTNSLISPIPFSVSTVPATTGGFQTIAGSALLPLPANTTIALELGTGIDGNTVLDPSFNIFQVAPLNQQQLRKRR